MAESWWSDSGLSAGSTATSWRISARTAVDDALPPASVASAEPKKYFSSKVPSGVAMYLAVVTREMVLSCRPSSSAISRSTSGRIAISPCVKKPFCRSTMACDTRTMVSKRCCTFLTNQRASCSRAASGELPLPRAPLIACAYRSLMRSRGITSGLSTTFQPRPVFCTITSGTTTAPSERLKGRPGLGSQVTIRPCAARSRSSSAPVAAASFLKSRRASRSRCCLQMITATACTSLRGCARSCSSRHSDRLRAPTPSGSRLCSQRSAQFSRSTRASRSPASSSSGTSCCAISSGVSAR